MPRAMTITEKIMARSAGLAEVIPGQIVSARIGLLYSSELGAKRMFDHLKSLGATGVFDAEKRKRMSEISLALASTPGKCV